MPFSDGVYVTRGGELLDGILTDRLEQLIPAAVAELQEERFLDEPGGESRDLCGRLAIDRADLLDRTKIDPTREHRHPSKQAPLVLGEESIAPFHGRSERALAPSARRACCGSKPKRSSRCREISSRSR